MTEVFVDTGAWIACINPHDQNYQQATSYLVDLRKSNTIMVTSDYIIDETLTWLRYNVSHHAAVNVMNQWKEAEKIKILTVEWITAEMAEQAWEIFRSYRDQKLSFTDCTSFVVCRTRKIANVFGFDRDFNTLGFLLSPFQVHEEKAEYHILKP